MSQRRYGKIINQNGEEVDDPEQAELMEEMGHLSGTNGRAIGGHTDPSKRFGSGGAKRDSTRSIIASRIALVAIWLFIIASVIFALMTGTRGIDTVSRISSAWGLSKEQQLTADELWLQGSGRKDLNFNTTFNPDDLTMTKDECDAFFPKLYDEIERSKKYYTEKEVWDKAYLESTCDDGWWPHARFVIYNNRLYIKYLKNAGFTRTEAAAALLHQAVSLSREKLPNVEFCVGMHDWGSKGKFSLDRRPEQEDLWLMPDYGYWSWPEHVGMYNEMRQKLAKVDNEVGWKGKKDLLFWRGSMRVGTSDREGLMETAKGYPWNEMKEIVWGDPTKGPISMEDHCRYKFHAYPEGNTYSGRVRYLQNCAVVIVTHEQRWIQHYTHLWNGEWGHPDQNIVYVPKPLDDDPEKGILVHVQDSDKMVRNRAWERLPEVMDKLLKDDAMAQRIANNVLKTFRDRYVTPATAPCYWREAIRAFASVQKYEVQLDGTETTYENFLLHGIPNA